MRAVTILLFSFVSLLSSTGLTQTKQADVPHVVRYSGTLKNVDGSPRVGTVGISFSIYADQASTAPLWQEVQNVVIDDTGHYSVLLGASRSEGLPDGLFAGNDARWLGIRVENEQEQPRAILAAVPYALKAADAETLGGKPLSAFVLNDAASGGTAGATGGAATSPSSTANKIGSQPLSVNTTSSGGTQNQIAKWTDAGGTILGNSLLTDTGSAVGLSNTTPTTALDVAGTIRAVLNPSAPFGTYLMPTGGAANSFRFGFGNNLYFDGTNWRTKGDGVNNAGSGIVTDIGTGALSIFTLPSTGATDQVLSNSGFNAFEKMRISQTGSVGIGTTAPATTLDVSGTIRAVLGAGSPFGTYLMPTGGLANSFRFGFGNNLYFDGTNWRTKGDSVHNAGSALLTDIVSGQMSIFALPSTGGTDQVISDASFNNFEVMRIAGNGNVGIGTSNPAQKLDVNGNVNASGNVAAAAFSGSGASLTSLPAANLNGTVPNAALSGTYSNAVTLSNASNSFTGNGSGLTSLAAANLTGTLGNGQLSGTYSNAVTLSNASNSFAGNGANLANVNAVTVAGVSSSALNLRLITYLGGCDSCSVLTASDNQKLIYQNLLGAPLTIQSITCYSDTGTPSVDIQRDSGGTLANVTGSPIGCSTTPTAVTSFSLATLNANDKVNFLMTTPDLAAHRVTVIIKATL